MPANTYGRQVVEALVNKSGGSVAAGDVVIIDTTNDGAFTTTTSGRSEVTIGIVQETIASNATGRVLLSGFAALVNVPASVTRGHYVETHTVAKQATGSSTRRSGSFGQFRTGGTTPTAVIWGNSDQTATASALTHTTQGTTSAGASFATRGMYLKKLTLASDGLVSSIHAFLKGDGTTVTGLVPVIYSDVSGTPTNLLMGVPPNITTTPTRAISSILNTTVRDISFPVGRWMTAGDYWFGLWISDALGTAVYLANTATGGTGGTVSGGAVNQPVDSSIQAITTNSVDYSIYIDVLR